MSFQRTNSFKLSNNIPQQPIGQPIHRQQSSINNNTNNNNQYSSQHHVQPNSFGIAETYQPHTQPRPNVNNNNNFFGLASSPSSLNIQNLSRSTLSTTNPPSPAHTPRSSSHSNNNNTNVNSSQPISPPNLPQSTNNRPGTHIRRGSLQVDSQKLPAIQRKPRPLALPNNNSNETKPPQSAHSISSRTLLAEATNLPPSTAPVNSPEAQLALEARLETEEQNFITALFNNINNTARTVPGLHKALSPITAHLLQRSAASNSITENSSILLSYNDFLAETSHSSSICNQKQQEYNAALLEYESILAKKQLNDASVVKILEDIAVDNEVLIAEHMDIVNNTLRQQQTDSKQGNDIRVSFDMDDDEFSIDHAQINANNSKLFSISTKLASNNERKALLEDNLRQLNTQHNKTIEKIVEHLSELSDVYNVNNTDLLTKLTEKDKEQSDSAENNLPFPGIQNSEFESFITNYINDSRNELSKSSTKDDDMDGLTNFDFDIPMDNDDTDLYVDGSNLFTLTKQLLSTAKEQKATLLQDLTNQQKKIIKTLVHRVISLKSVISTHVAEKVLFTDILQLYHTRIKMYMDYITELKSALQQTFSQRLLFEIELQRHKFEYSAHVEGTVEHNAISDTGCEHFDQNGNITWFQLDIAAKNKTYLSGVHSRVKHILIQHQALAHNCTNLEMIYNQDLSRLNTELLLYQNKYNVLLKMFHNDKTDTSDANNIGKLKDLLISHKKLYINLLSIINDNIIPKYTELFIVNNSNVEIINNLNTVIYNNNVRIEELTTENRAKDERIRELENALSNLNSGTMPSTVGPCNDHNVILDATVQNLHFSPSSPQQQSYREEKEKSQQLDTTNYINNPTTYNPNVPVEFMEDEVIAQYPMEIACCNCNELIAIDFPYTFQHLGEIDIKLLMSYFNNYNTNLKSFGNNKYPKYMLIPYCEYYVDDLNSQNITNHSIHHNNTNQFQFTTNHVINIKESLNYIVNNVPITSTQQQYIKYLNQLYNNNNNNAQQQVEPQHNDNEFYLNWSNPLVSHSFLYKQFQLYKKQQMLYYESIKSKYLPEFAQEEEEEITNTFGNVHDDEFEIADNNNHQTIWYIDGNEIDFMSIFQTNSIEEMLILQTKQMLWAGMLYLIQQYTLLSPSIISNSSHQKEHPITFSATSLVNNNHNDHLTAPPPRLTPQLYFLKLLSTAHKMYNYNKLAEWINLSLASPHLTSHGFTQVASISLLLINRYFFEKTLQPPSQTSSTVTTNIDITTAPQPCSMMIFVRHHNNSNQSKVSKQKTVDSTSPKVPSNFSKDDQMKHRYFQQSKSFPRHSLESDSDIDDVDSDDDGNNIDNIGLMFEDPFAYSENKLNQDKKKRKVTYQNRGNVVETASLYKHYGFSNVESYTNNTNGSQPVAQISRTMTSLGSKNLILQHDHIPKIDVVVALVDLHTGHRLDLSINNITLQHDLTLPLQVLTIQNTLTKVSTSPDNNNNNAQPINIFNMYNKQNDPLIKLQQQYSQMMIQKGHKNNSGGINNDKNSSQIVGNPTNMMDINQSIITQQRQAECQFSLDINNVSNIEQDLVQYHVIPQWLLLPDNAQPVTNQPQLKLHQSQITIPTFSPSRHTNTNINVTIDGQQPNLTTHNNLTIVNNSYSNHMTFMTLDKQQKDTFCGLLSNYIQATNHSNNNPTQQSSL